MRINAASLLHTQTRENNLKEKSIISKYEGLLKRCADVYFTSNGLLLFHCVLCENEELTDVKELCEHLTNEHQNVFTEKDTDAEEDLVPSQDEFNEDEKFDDDYCSSENQHEYLQIKHIIEDIRPEGDNSIDEELLSIVEYTITPAEVDSIDLVPSDEEKQIIDRESKSNDELNASVSAQRTAAKKEHRAGPRINDDEERRFKCTVCDLAFKEGYNLRQHLRRHSEAERFKCSQCSKRFHTRTELNTHLRRHTGETPFMCAECGRQFVTSGALTQHMRRHLNLRPCECDVCGKCFYDTSQLKHHYIVHTRERTHTCTTCNAKFARRKSLVTHMKIHANKREYVCHLCQAGFNQAPGLRMHLRNKHKDVISVQEMLNKEKKI